MWPLRARPQFRFRLGERDFRDIDLVYSAAEGSKSNTRAIQPVVSGYPGSGDAIPLPTQPRQPSLSLSAAVHFLRISSKSGASGAGSKGLRCRTHMAPIQLSPLGLNVDVVSFP